MQSWGTDREVEKPKPPAKLVKPTPDEVAQRERAKQNLVHYFRTAFNGAGLQFDSDNVAEVRDIVDALVDAAGAHLAAGLQHRIDALEARLARLEGRSR
jgi:hypothetical protein